MKLYYAPGVCSLAVRIVLNEAAIVCQYEAVNLKTKLTAKDDDFLKINSKGAVPVLELDNGELLTECPIIMQYLADTYHLQNMLPSRGDFNRYRILEWLSFINTDLHKNCALLFSSKTPSDIKENIFLKKLKAQLSVIEEYLYVNNFLGCHQFSIADAYLFVIIFWLGMLKLDITKWPCICRYYKQLRSRKSVIKSLQDEALI